MIAGAVMLDGEITIDRAHAAVVVGQVASHLLGSDHAVGRLAGEVVCLHRGIGVGRHPAVAAERVVDVDGTPARHRVDRCTALSDDDVGALERRRDVEALLRAPTWLTSTPCRSHASRTT